MRILLAEDERDLNELIVKKLEKEGYSVDSVSDGEDAYTHLLYQEYDIAILDIMMPKKDGLSIVRDLRQKRIFTKVLLLTARDTVDDKVKGLDIGANDYMVKPFSFKELMARLRVLTREKYGQSDEVLRLSDLSLNRSSKEVRRAGELISLSAKEYALLEYLMLNAGRVLSRTQIEDHVWNMDTSEGNAVDVYISHLRKKVDADSPQKLIKTLRGQGYTIREDR